MLPQAQKERMRVESMLCSEIRAYICPTEYRYCKGLAACAADPVEVTCAPTIRMVSGNAVFLRLRGPSRAKDACEAIFVFQEPVVLLELLTSCLRRHLVGGVFEAHWGPYWAPLLRLWKL